MSFRDLENSRLPRCTSRPRELYPIILIRNSVIPVAFRLSVHDYTLNAAETPDLSEAAVIKTGIELRRGHKRRVLLLHSVFNHSADSTSWVKVVDFVA